MHPRKITFEEYIRAAGVGNVKVVSQYLEDNKSNPAAIDAIAGYRSALHNAISEKQYEVVKILITAGADVNLKVIGVPALQRAVEAGDLRIVDLLLHAKNIDVNARSDDREYALGQAAKFAYVDIFHVLLLANAKLYSQSDMPEAISESHEKIILLGHYHAIFRKLLNAHKRIFKQLGHDINVRIAGLTPNQFIRFVSLLNNLAEIKQLHKDSIELALNQAAVKLPELRKSDKVREVLASEVKYLLDDEKVYFLKRDASNIETNDRVSQSVINHGYKNASSIWAHETPDFAVKRLLPSQNADDEELQELRTSAKNEARFLKFVGRETACWYENKTGPVVVSNYVPGKSLTDLQANHFDFRKLSKSFRFELLASYFSRLNYLHANGLMHGDINPDNVVKNGNELDILDYVSAHKIGSLKEYPSTPEYCDIFGEGNQASSDIYQSAFILAEVFPEYFKVEQIPSIPYALRVVPRNNQLDGVMHIALLNLYKALTDQYREHRCTSLQALQFCQEITEKTNKKTDQLSAHDLHDILCQTLNRKHFVKEDGLLGSKRAEKFAAGDDQAGGFAVQLGLTHKVNVKQVFTMFSQRIRRQKCVDERYRRRAMLLNEEVNKSDSAPIILYR